MEVTQAEGDAGQAQAAPAAPEFDIGPVTEQVNKLSESIGDRLNQIETRLAPPEDPYNRNDLGQFAGLPPEQQGFAGQPYQQQQYGGMQPGQVPGQGQEMFDPMTGELTPEAARAQLQAMMDPMLQPLQAQQQQMQQMIAQQQEFMQNLEIDRGAADLEQRYPELQTKEKADALVARATEMAQQIGSPDLVGRAGFLEMAHKAMLADAAAANETAATPGPSLEAAGGASLAAAEDSPQQRILNAKPRNPLWGV